jgi:hypothetical protein
VQEVIPNSSVRAAAGIIFLMNLFMTVYFLNS